MILIRPQVIVSQISTTDRDENCVSMHDFEKVIHLSSNADNLK